MIALIGGEFHSIALLVLAAVLIDAGLVINFVLSQRAIYGPKPASRSASAACSRPCSSPAAHSVQLSSCGTMF